MYEYKIIDNSIFAKFLNPICEKIQKYIPKFITPNMITLTGVASTLTALYISPFKNACVAPTISLLTCTYTVMDTLDGIHARKTNQTSLLGEFLDHICDCIFSSYMFLILCNLTNVTDETTIYVSKNLPPLIFAISHAEAYKNGFVYFGTFTGPLEMLFIYILFVLFNGFYNIPIFSLHFYTFVFLFVSFLLYYHTKSLPIFLTSLYSVLGLYYQNSWNQFASICMVSELILAKMQMRKIKWYVFFIVILSWFHDISYFVIGMLFNTCINLQKIM